MAAARDLLLSNHVLLKLTLTFELLFSRPFRLITKSNVPIGWDADQVGTHSSNGSIDDLSTMARMEYRE
jgi:hypothetical protein